MTDLLQLLDDQPEKTGAPPPGSLLDSLNVTPDAAVENSLGVVPETRAKDLNNSRKTGLGVDTIENNRDIVNEEEERSDLLRLLDNAPKASEYFTKNPDTLPAAKDDLNTLTKIEKRLSFMGAVERGVDLLQQNYYAGLEAVGEAVDAKDLIEYGREGRIFNEAQIEAQGAPRTKVEDIKDLDTGWQWFKETFGEQGVMMAPSMAGGLSGAKAGALATSWIPIPGARIAGATIGGFLGAFIPNILQSVGEVQSAIKQKDPDAVAPGVAIAAGTAVSALDSVIPGKVGTKVVKAFGLDPKEAAADAAIQALSRSLIQRVGSAARGGVKSAGIEGVTEAIQEAITEVASSYAVNQDVNIDELKSAMLNGFAGGLVMGKVVGTGSTAVSDAYKTKRAREYRDNISAILDDTRESLLHQRSPEIFQEFFESLASSDMTEINVAAQPVVAYMQSQNVDPVETLEMLGVDMNQANRAFEQGGDITIPAARFFDAMSDGPLFELRDGFLMNLREEENVPTLAEGEANTAATEKHLTEQVEKVRQDLEGTRELDQIEQDAERLRTSVTEEVEKTGRHTRAGAQRIAALYENFFITQASDPGMDRPLTLEEVFPEIRMRSVAYADRDTPMVEGLEQSAAETATTPARMEFMDDQFATIISEVGKNQNHAHVARIDIDTFLDLTTSYERDAIEMEDPKTSNIEPYDEVSGTFDPAETDRADLNAIPYIRIGPDGRVRRHEGRHRAVLLKRGGATTIPIAIEFPEGVTSFGEKPGEPMPTQLIGQFDDRIVRDMPSTTPANYDNINVMRELVGEGSDTPTTGFQQWFSGSKIVDENGQPKVVYHGTVYDFDEFAPGEVLFQEDEYGVVEQGGMGDPLKYVGSHFTESTKVASRFAEGLYGLEKYAEEGGQVMPVYLKIENPYIVTESDLHNEMFRGDYDADIITAQIDVEAEDRVLPDDMDGFEFYEANEEFRIRVNEKALDSEQVDDPANDLAQEMGFALRQKLIDQGYDGVIYQNEVEGGESYIVFNANQVKSQFNIAPTQDDRILYQQTAAELDTDAINMPAREYGTPEERAAHNTMVEVLETLRDGGRLNDDALDQLARYQGGEDTEFLGEFLEAVGQMETVGEIYARHLETALEEGDAYEVESFTFEGDLFDFAKLAKGVTDDINIAGYILPDGSMLDFSAGQGGRYEDHRQLNIPLKDPETGEFDPGSGTGQMLAFMAAGAIRVDAASASIDIAAEPTARQIRTLTREFDEVPRALMDGMNVDLQDGDRTRSLQGVDLDRLPSLIRRFYAGDDVVEFFQGGLPRKPRGVARINKHGVAPYLRQKAKPVGELPKRPYFVQETNNRNATTQIDNLNPILERHPEAHTSPEKWAQMMAEALADDDVPAAPYQFIKAMENKGAEAIKSLKRLTPGQIKAAAHGFKNAARFRREYIKGNIGIEHTTKLFLWSYLSRGVSPYQQESMFIDVYKGIDKFIGQAARQELDLEAYLAWAETQAPMGSGQPGAGTSHNLNSFGRDFLTKMALGVGDGSGRSRLEYLHDMMADPKMTGKQIRREFAKFGQGVGIDNKVLSFTLLVAGFDDVMVIDRVQLRQMWNDGRYTGYNLWDGIKVPSGADPTKKIQKTGSALEGILYGARGLLIYEAIERGIAHNIDGIYKALGRPKDGSVGRYHWESWIADSAQEASHGTLDAVIAHAVDDKADAIHETTSMQGEYGRYAFGARYGVTATGIPYFNYTAPDGLTYVFRIPQFVEFLETLQDPAAGVVPQSLGKRQKKNKKGVLQLLKSGEPAMVDVPFSVSKRYKMRRGKLVLDANNQPIELEELNAPWYTRPEVNENLISPTALALAEGIAGNSPGTVRGPDGDADLSDRPPTDKRLSAGWAQPGEGPTGREFYQDVPEGQTDLRGQLYTRTTGPFRNPLIKVVQDLNLPAWRGEGLRLAKGSDIWQALQSKTKNLKGTNAKDLIKWSGIEQMLVLNPEDPGDFYIEVTERGEEFMVEAVQGYWGPFPTRAEAEDQLQKVVEARKTDRSEELEYSREDVIEFLETDGFPLVTEVVSGGATSEGQESRWEPTQIEDAITLREEFNHSIPLHEVTVTRMYLDAMDRETDSVLRADFGWSETRPPNTLFEFLFKALMKVKPGDTDGQVFFDGIKLNFDSDTADRIYHAVDAGYAFYAGEIGTTYDKHDQGMVRQDLDPDEPNLLSQKFAGYNFKETDKLAETFNEIWEEIGPPPTAETQTLDMFDEADVPKIVPRQLGPKRDEGLAREREEYFKKGEAELLKRLQVNPFTRVTGYQGSWDMTQKQAHEEFVDNFMEAIVRSVQDRSFERFAGNEVQIHFEVVGYSDGGRIVYIPLFTPRSDDPTERMGSFIGGAYYPITADGEILDPVDSFNEAQVRASSIQGSAETFWGRENMVLNLGSERKADLDESYREWKLIKPDLAHSFREPQHEFREDKILAFGRITMRTIGGKVVLMIDEFQSDMDTAQKKYGSVNEKIKGRKATEAAFQIARGKVDEAFNALRESSRKGEEVFEEISALLGVFKFANEAESTSMEGIVEDRRLEDFSLRDESVSGHLTDIIRFLMEDPELHKHSGPDLKIERIDYSILLFPDNPIRKMMEKDTLISRAHNAYIGVGDQEDKKTYTRLQTALRAVMRKALTFEHIIEKTTDPNVRELVQNLADAIGPLSRKGVYTKAITDIDSWIMQIPDAPFMNDQWASLILKRMLVEAMEKGHDAIAWPNGYDMAQNRWSHGALAMYHMLYDQKMVGAAETVTGVKPKLYAINKTVGPDDTTEKEMPAAIPDKKIPSFEELRPVFEDWVQETYADRGRILDDNSVENLRQKILGLYRDESPELEFSPEMTTYFEAYLQDHFEDTLTVIRGSDSVLARVAFEKAANAVIVEAMTPRTQFSDNVRDRLSSYLATTQHGVILDDMSYGDIIEMAEGMGWEEPFDSWDGDTADEAEQSARDYIQANIDGANREALLAQVERGLNRPQQRESFLGILAGALEDDIQKDDPESLNIVLETMLQSLAGDDMATPTDGEGFFVSEGARRKLEKRLEDAIGYGSFHVKSIMMLREGAPALVFDDDTPSAIPEITEADIRFVLPGMAWTATGAEEGPGGKPSYKIEDSVEALGEYVDGLIKSKKTVVNDRAGYWYLPITQEIIDEYEKHGYSLMQDPSTPRGRAVIGEQDIKIETFENADLSTVLHETGHVFVNLMERVALRSGASARQKEIYTSMLEFVGAGSAADLDPRLNGDAAVEKQEMLAEAFEAYLREGRAPSTRLRRAFAVFKAWLIEVYKSLVGLNVELTDDVRSAFDKMLATDAEIEQMHITNGMDTSVSAPGLFDLLSAEERTKWTDLDEEAKDQARQTALVEEKMAVQREAQQRFQERLEQNKRRVEQQMYENRPEYRAFHLLVNGEFRVGNTPASLADRRLSKAMLLEMGYTQEDLNALPKGRRAIYTDDANTATDPALMASILRFDSVEEMMTAIKNMTPPNTAIDRDAGIMTRSELGDPLNDGTLERLTEEALYNERRAQAIQIEFDALANKTGQQSVARETIKAIVDRIFDESPVSEILKPMRYQSAAVRAARETERAIAKKDFVEAFRQKRLHMLNHELFRRALKGRQDVERITRRLRNYQRTPIKSRNVDPGFIGQIKNLLEFYEFSGVSVDRIEGQAAADVMAFIVKQRADGEPVIMPGNLVEFIGEDDDGTPEFSFKVKSWKQMTMTELEALRDMADNLMNLGRQRSEDAKAAKQRRGLDLADNIRARARPRKNKKDTLAVPIVKEQRKSAMRGFFPASHRKMESMMFELDGFENLGPMWSAVFDKLTEAQNTKTVLIEMLSKEYSDIFDVYTAKERYLIRREASGVAIEALGGKRLTREQRMSIALNWGNESSQEAVLESSDFVKRYGELWNEDAIMEILGTLDARDVAVINRVWEMVNQFWEDVKLPDGRTIPGIASLERENTGVVPERVKGNPFTVNGNAFTGGYYPLKYNRFSDRRAARESEQDIQNRLKSGGFSRAQTSHGFTIERIGSGGRPIQWDLGVMLRHMDEVSQDIAFRRAVNDAAEIIGNVDVQEAIVETMGEAYLTAMQEILVKTANGNLATSDSWADLGILKTARLNTTVALMGLNLRSIFTQPLGLTQTIARLGIKDTIQGFAEFWHNPASILRRIREVDSKSTFMRERAKMLTREVDDVVNRLDTPGIQDNIRKLGFSGMILMDVVSVAYPTWIGAYNKAMNGKVDNVRLGDEKAAIKYADMTVRTTQGSAGASNLSMVQQSSELSKLMTMFYSYFNTTYNMQTEAYRKMRAQGISIKSGGEFLGQTLLLQLIPAVLGALLLDALPEDDDIEEDPEGVWAMWTLMSIFKYGIGQVVGYRDVGNSITSGFDFSLTPVEGTIKKGIKSVRDLKNIPEWVENDEVPETFIRNMATVFGMALGIPGSVQMVRTYNYYRKLEEGTLKAGDPDSKFEEVYRALIRGDKVF